MSVLIRFKQQKPKNMPWEDWLLAKVRKTRGCWYWRGHSPNGRYGNMTYEGKKRPAHVVSYILFVGPVPEGMNVLHTCDNGFCVRPDHLWLGTHADNMADKKRKGRASKKHLVFSVDERAEMGARLKAAWASKTKEERKAIGAKTQATIRRKYGKVRPWLI